jgi:hypothetical protein
MGEKCYIVSSRNRMRGFVGLMWLRIGFLSETVMNLRVP